MVTENKCYLCNIKTQTNMENKTHWKKQFNYDYLGSYSLPDGKDVVLTIKETKKEMVTSGTGSKEECFICYFVEKYDWVKPMILNRTNCKAIEKVYSTPYIEEWAGKKIQIGIEQGIKAFGDVVDGLRVRKVMPKPREAMDVNHPKFAEALEKVKAGTAKIEAIEKYYELTAEARKQLTEAK